MSETTQDFELGAVLSVVTDRMLAVQGIDDLYRILNFMTRDNLFTHQLPRALRECKPWLLRQHPELAGVDASGVTAANWNLWLREMKAKYGETLPVAPVPMDDHTRRDPMAELAEMVNDPSKIIAINTERDHV
jgi:hypothetical protein